MKNTILTLAAILFMVSAFPAMALDLHSARSSGLVGEARDGYAEVIVDRADVQSLVADVNAKRKAEYARISQENGQSVDVVAKLAAEKIINRLNAGEYFEAADGSWKKR